MTDTQILTIALAVVVPLSMLIYSNSRITEAKETLRAEIKASTAELLAEIHALASALKIHELEHHK
jgi:hypothetical protein